MSKVLVISTSLRAKSNSDILTEKLIEGAKASGHDVEYISLKGKNIGFCIGCLACQNTQRCVTNDDAVEIDTSDMTIEEVVDKVIYYYEMSGQMKTLLDRLNPLYPSDYKFRNVYMLSVAAEDEEFVPQKAESGLQGWVDCFEKAEFSGSLFCGGIGDMGEASGKKEELSEAYEFGKTLK